MEEKQKCRKNENLMEPKAGAQEENLNVHSLKIGYWSFFRLIIKFAECTPFILICSSPSPRPQSPREKQGFGVNSQKALALPSHPFHPILPGDSGQPSFAEGGRPELGAKPSWALCCCHPSRACSLSSDTLSC